jgi:4-hydroxy-tetrahydrodipicolinate synthase
LYNIPIFTGVNIKPETTVRLASLDNVIGIKEEAALFPLQASEILTRLTADSDFSVYCGDDTMVLPVLAQGGSGAVSGTSHITGDLMKAQIEAFFSGRIDEAIELHHKTYRFTMSLFPGERVNPVPLTKAALALTGFDVGPPRRPLLPPSEDEAGAMKSVLKAIGKL